MGEKSMRIRFKYFSDKGCDAGFFNTHQVKVGARIFSPYSLWLCCGQSEVFFGLPPCTDDFTVDLRWIPTKQKGFRPIKLGDRCRVICEMRKEITSICVDGSITELIEAITKSTTTTTLWVRRVKTK